MPYPSSNAETTVHAVRRLPTSESRIERSSNGRWEIVSTAPGRPFTERRSVNVGTAASRAGLDERYEITYGLPGGRDFDRLVREHRASIEEA